MTKNLSKKLLKVSLQLEKVNKSGYNSHQKYHYSNELDLHEALKPALEENGVSIMWSVKDVSFLKNEDVCLVTIEYTITDTESGEQIVITSAGTGHDKQDKAIYKAMTGAHKYFIMKFFMVSGEDDPEKDIQKPSNVSEISATNVKKTSTAKPKSVASGFGFGAPKDKPQDDVEEVF